MRDTPPFLEQALLFYKPLFLWENPNPPFFGKITKTQTLLHKKGGSNYNDVRHNFTEKKVNQKYKKKQLTKITHIQSKKKPFIILQLKKYKNIYFHHPL